MEFETIKDEKNNLLKRRNLTLKMKFTGSTLSKVDLQEMFAKEFKADPENVEIVKILTEHGKSAGQIWIKIWDEKKVGRYKKKGEATEEKKE